MREQQREVSTDTGEHNSTHAHPHDPSVADEEAHEQKMLEERTAQQTLEKRAARVIENLGKKPKNNRKAGKHKVFLLFKLQENLPK